MAPPTTFATTTGRSTAATGSTTTPPSRHRVRGSAWNVEPPKPEKLAAIFKRCDTQHNVTQNNIKNATLSITSFDAYAEVR